MSNTWHGKKNLDFQYYHNTTLPFVMSGIKKKLTIDLYNTKMLQFQYITPNMYVCSIIVQ